MESPPPVVPCIEYPRCDLKELAELLVGNDKKVTREVCVYVSEDLRLDLLANLVTALRKMRKGKRARYLTNTGRETSYQVPEKDGDSRGEGVVKVEWGNAVFRLGKSVNNLGFRGTHDRCEFFIHDEALARASGSKRKFLEEQHLSCFRVVLFTVCRPAQKVSNAWNLKAYEQANWRQLKKKLKVAKLIRVKNCAWMSIIILSTLFIVVVVLGGK